LARRRERGGSLTAVVTFRSGPGASRRCDDTQGEARVEYRLVRNSVVEAVRRGKLNPAEVCDAHPELLRAARNVGRPLEEGCPICAEGHMVEVTYVFGAGLPAGGRCPGTHSELNRLRRRAEPVFCYDVEVCPGCAWHHLVRKYPAGGTARREVRRKG